MKAPESSSQSEFASGDLVLQLQALQTHVDQLDSRIMQLRDLVEGGMYELLKGIELVYDNDRDTLRMLREARRAESYDLAFEEEQPLVSVVIGTWNRPESLVERSIPSVLAQSYPNIEIVVVGDCSPPEVEQALNGIGDSRIRFHNRTVRGPYSKDPLKSWLAVGSLAFSEAIQLARGHWIAPLADDDAFTPDHISKLIDFARRDRLEFVYDLLELINPDGSSAIFGKVFPPEVGKCTLQNALMHSALKCFELELGCAEFHTPNDGSLIQRMMRCGVRMGSLDHVGVRYFPSERSQEFAPQWLERKNRASEAAIRLSQASADPFSQVQAQMQKSREEAAALRSRIVELQREVDHRGEVINGVTNSASWKVTAPLRRFKQRR